MSKHFLLRPLRNRPQAVIDTTVTRVSFVYVAGKKDATSEICVKLAANEMVDTSSEKKSHLEKGDKVLLAVIKVDQVDQLARIYTVPSNQCSKWNVLEGL